MDTMKLKSIAFAASVLASAAMLAVFSYTFPPRYALSKCFSGREIGFTREARAAEAAKVGLWGWDDSTASIKALHAAMGCGDLGFGVATDYQKALSSPMTSSQSFVPVTSLALRDGTSLTMAALGSKVFLTLEPGASNEEIVMCTGIDSSAKQFTGCTRGLGFSGSSTAAIPANAKTHSSGSTVVMSNVHYVYQQFLEIDGGSQTVSTTVAFVAFPSVTSTTAVPTLGSEFATKYYADTLSASGLSPSNVSTTLGLQALTGLSNCSTSGTCVGMNVSSTAGLAFDSAGRVYVSASTTGGISFDSAGRVKVDTSDSFAWTGTNSWTATSTFAGTSVPQPVSGSSAVPKSYADVRMQMFSGTSTADATITYGMALYASTTGRLGPTDTSSASSTFRFVGIALSSASAGSEVAYARPGGVVCGLSGLSAGTAMYLSGSSGALATTPGTYVARVGMALTSSCMQVSEPKYYISGVRTISGTGNNFETTWFYPAKITLGAGPETSNLSGGSFSTEGGVINLRMQGANNSVVATGPGVSYVCIDAGTGASECAGGVSARTANGFTIAVSNASVTHNYFWTAESM